MLFGLRALHIKTRFPERIRLDSVTGSQGRKGRERRKQELNVAVLTREETEGVSGDVVQVQVPLIMIN